MSPQAKVDVPQEIMTSNDNPNAPSTELSIHDSHTKDTQTKIRDGALIGFDPGGEVCAISKRLCVCTDDRNVHEVPTQTLEGTAKAISSKPLTQQGGNMDASPWSPTHGIS